MCIMQIKHSSKLFSYKITFIFPNYDILFFNSCTFFKYKKYYLIKPCHKYNRQGQNYQYGRLDTN